MTSKKCLLLTDNPVLYKKFLELIKEFKVPKNTFDFAHSPNNKMFADFSNITELKIQYAVENIIKKYNKVFSLHSKQIFPKKLVDTVTCINIHPGFNPYNRGWYPQVFAILNNTKIGATIHIMDEFLDHGAIIDRVEVNKEIWDTSESLYNKIIEAEISLIRENLNNILSDNFHAFIPEDEGKVFYKKDFDEICKIDLNKEGKFLDFYNLLRALSHRDYNNAYFITENNRKIYIKLVIKK